MPEAKSLKDLLRIREFPKNRKFFHALPGCLGTAVGYRYREKEHRFEEKDGKKIPAILVFVKEKIPFASLAKKWIIPEKFFGPDGLECASDVMLGEAPDRPLDQGRLSEYNTRLKRALHEKDLGVIGGVPVLPPGSTGTTGCVVTFPTTEPSPEKRKFGVLTNFHVAGFPGTQVVNGGGKVFPLGTTVQSFAFSPRLSGPNDFGHFLPHDTHRIDIGLVELSKVAFEKKQRGVHDIDQLGAPYQLDLDTMGPLGTFVVGVGQTLGLQEGQIMACGYEWRNDLKSSDWSGTDYLILSTGSQPFAAPGDSGKLVVTNDERRQPIALLWGGERHDFWNAPAQASCAYATDIGLALRLLKAEIY